MKIWKIIKIIILLAMITLLLICAYFLFIDIETKKPKNIEETYNVETQEYMQRKIFIIRPKEEKTSQTILYFHGGAYVAEATKNHWEFIEKLVKDTKSTVILPDYPLTPKYNYKDVFRMVVPLYKDILEKVNKDNLILMGDSAGGGISLALLEKLGEQNVPMPSKTLLISPWLDVRLNNEKIEEAEKNDKELNKETLKLAGIAYSGEDGMQSYLVNPIDGDLSKLKNVTIFTGTYDILNPDVHVLKQKAQEVGTDIEIKEYENAAHIWVIEHNSSQELIEQGYQDMLQKLTGN